MFVKVYLPVLCLALVQLATVAVQSQLVTLRHPESSGTAAVPRYQTNQAAPHLSLSTRPRFIARPGNVIVHFDRNHDIQRLQYVLGSGQLATLFQRHQRPGDSRPPMQIQSVEPPSGQVYRREDSSSTTPGKGGQTIELTSLGKIDNDQTIEIVNSKSQGVSRLVGDHVTLELPKSQTQTGGHLNADEDAKLEVLATVAADALEVGAHIGEAKLKKAGAFLEKLKSKVAAKMHDLPAIIDAKLRTKSEVNQVFIDKAGRKFVLLDEQNSSPTSQQKEVSIQTQVAAPQSATQVAPANQPVTLNDAHVVTAQPETSAPRGPQRRQLLQQNQQQARQDRLEQTALLFNRRSGENKDGSTLSAHQLIDK